MNVNMTLTYNITKNLVFKSTAGYDYNHFTDLQFNDSITPYAITQGSRKPIAGMDTVTKRIITNSNVLTWSVKGFKKIHDFDMLVGQETYDLRTESHTSLYGNYPLNTSPTKAFSETSLGTSFTGYPRLGKSRYTNMSFFGRVNYPCLAAIFSLSICGLMVLPNLRMARNGGIFRQGLLRGE